MTVFQIILIVVVVALLIVNLVLSAIMKYGKIDKYYQKIDEEKKNGKK